MSIDVVLSFSGIRPGSQPIIARTLEQVPFVSAGLLESCDIGVRREPASLLLRAHLSEGPGAADAVARLSSLAERANGVALSPPSQDPGAPAAASNLLEAADVTDGAIAPAALAAALERALRALGGDRADARVTAGGASAAAELAPRPLENVRYDARHRELSLTSDLAIPVGQALQVAVHSALTEDPVFGEARVVRLRRQAGTRRRSGGGFTVTLVPENEALHAAFVLAGAGEAIIAVTSGGGPRPRRRVLLVDDLPERLPAFADAIRGGGFELRVIAGAGAIPVSELVAADLVLLTTADPVRVEAPLRTFRLAGARDLPVLVASAAPSTFDPRLLQVGADAIVSSQIAPGDLVDTVRGLLGCASVPLAAPLAASHDTRDRRGAGAARA